MPYFLCHAALWHIRGGLISRICELLYILYPLEGKTAPAYVFHSLKLFKLSVHRLNQCTVHCRSQILMGWIVFPDISCYMKIKKTQKLSISNPWV